MQMLLPHAVADVDPQEVYAATDRRAGPDRPWVLLNMIASADGGTAVDGVSGSLGGPPDQRVFAAIRALADVILVAAGTVRAEGYGPPRTADLAIAARHARGQAAHPRLAIVSGSLDLDPATAIFAAAEPGARPLVVTTRTADEERRDRLAPVADIVEAGDTTVDMAEAVAELGRLGAGVVLCEGGPSLNGQLAGADLVDELCLTLAPYLVAGDSSRIVRGGPADRRHYDLAHVLSEDGLLFARYLRTR